VATFDQLPAEQRAIIELVVTRGRTYDALADVLQVSAARVRELALDALIELSPVSGDRVDPQWRSQIADYILGQQSGAESTATQAHLRRSEASRTWALSLLDSLETLYGDGDRPSIPDAEESGRGRRGDGAGPAVAVADGEGEERAEAAATPKRERDRKRDRAPREPAERPDRASLSPEAQDALGRRRRLIGAGIGALVLAAIVVGVLAIAGVFSGSDNNSSTKASSTTPTTSTAAGSQAQVVGQIPLQPIGGAKAQGAAFILLQGGKPVLAVQAKLPPLPASQRKAAYNVWLFNSPKDAFSIGAQFTDAQGNYQGVKELPANYKRFKFVDISIQPFNNRTAHSGRSILRGAFANLQPVQQQPQGGGTSTTPTP
jgi:hypothetical protein